MIDTNIYELLFSEKNISGDAIQLLAKFLSDSAWDISIDVYNRRWKNYKFICKISSKSDDFEMDLKKYLWKDSILVLVINDSIYEELANTYDQELVDINSSPNLFEKIFGVKNQYFKLICPLSENSLIVHHDALSMFYCRKTNSIIQS